MKSASFLLTGVLFSILFAGCTSEEPEDNNGNVNNLPTVTLYAHDNSTNTRTTTDETGIVKWSATDAINVNGQASATTEVLNDGAGAKFTVAATGPYYALYPAKIVKSFDAVSKLFTVELPDQQPYKSGTSFADDVNPSVANAAGLELNFLNICGVLKASLKSKLGREVTRITKVRFLSNNGWVAGSATIDPKTLTLTSKVGGVKNAVDIVFDTPQSLPSDKTLDVLWVLPVGTYTARSRVQLIGSNAGSEVVLSECIIENPINIARSKMTTLTTGEFVSQIHVTFSVEGGGTVSTTGGYYTLGEQINCITSAPSDHAFIGWFANDDPIGWNNSTTQSVECRADAHYTARWTRGLGYGDVIWAPGDLIRVGGEYKFSNDQYKIGNLDSTSDGWTQSEMEQETISNGTGDPCTLVKGEIKWRLPRENDSFFYANWFDESTCQKIGNLFVVETPTSQGNLAFSDEYGRVGDINDFGNGESIERAMKTNQYGSNTFRLVYSNGAIQIMSAKAENRVRIRCVADNGR